MKRIILIVVASVFLNQAAALSGDSLPLNNYAISFGQGQLDDSGYSVIYQVGTVIKSDWFGIFREIPLPKFEQSDPFYQSATRSWMLFRPR